MQSLGFSLAFRRALLQPLAARKVNKVEHACTVSIAATRDRGNQARRSPAGRPPRVVRLLVTRPRTDYRALRRNDSERGIGGGGTVVEH